MGWKLHQINYSHTDTHYFVEFCRDRRLRSFVLDIFPQIYASICKILLWQRFTHFLCWTFSHKFVEFCRVYILLLKSNPGDFLPIQSWVTGYNYKAADVHSFSCWIFKKNPHWSRSNINTCLKNLYKFQTKVK